MSSSVIAHQTIQCYGMNISRFYFRNAGCSGDNFSLQLSFPWFLLLLAVQRSDQASLIQYILHIFRQFRAGVRFAVHFCGSLGHMKDHGITVFYGIRQVFTDNRRQTNIDGVAEKRFWRRIFAITACTPNAFKTPGACSLDEPQPKFSPPTTKYPGFTFFAKSGSNDSNAWPFISSRFGRSRYCDAMIWSVSRSL